MCVCQSILVCENYLCVGKSLILCVYLYLSGWKSLFYRVFHVYFSLFGGRIAYFGVFVRVCSCIQGTPMGYLVQIPPGTPKSIAFGNITFVCK